MRVNNKDECFVGLCRGFLILYHDNLLHLHQLSHGVKWSFSSRCSSEYNKYKSSGHHCSRQSWPDTTLQLHRAQAHVKDFFVVRYSNSAEASFILLHASRHKCQGLGKPSEVERSFVFSLLLLHICLIHQSLLYLSETDKYIWDEWRDEWFHCQNHRETFQM